MSYATQRRPCLVDPCLLSGQTDEQQRHFNEEPFSELHKYSFSKWIDRYQF